MSYQDSNPRVTLHGTHLQTHRRVECPKGETKGHVSIIIDKDIVISNTEEMVVDSNTFAIDVESQGIMEGTDVRGGIRSLGRWKA